MVQVKVRRNVCFLLLPKVHLLDLAGAAQVFYEANGMGQPTYSLQFCAASKSVSTEQGLQLGSVEHFSNVNLRTGDFLFVPGIDFASFAAGELAQDVARIAPWLRAQHAHGVRIASVCSGSLILAEAGLLDGKRCTTHWKCIDYMKKHYPLALVEIDKLYVRDQSVYTSAGMTSGIDMALSILEADYGPVLPAKVAREIVVYIRRNEADSQQTIYLDYRTHFNPSVHKVQDFIISNPSRNPSLEELASIGNTSVRSLTRMFKKATGHTIIEFKNAVKVELARRMVHNNEFTMEKISSMCGFESVRHFRRVWTSNVGMSLHEYRSVKERV